MIRQWIRNCFIFAGCATRIIFPLRPMWLLRKCWCWAWTGGIWIGGISSIRSRNTTGNRFSIDFLSVWVIIPSVTIPRGGRQSTLPFRTERAVGEFASRLEAASGFRIGERQRRSGDGDVRGLSRRSENGAERAAPRRRRGRMWVAPRSMTGSSCSRPAWSGDGSIVFCRGGRR